MSFQVTKLIENLGFLASFGMYSALLGGSALLLPLMYIYGKRIRTWSAGKLEARPYVPRDDKEKQLDEDDDWRANKYPDEPPIEMKGIAL